MRTGPFIGASPFLLHLNLFEQSASALRGCWCAANEPR